MMTTTMKHAHWPFVTANM
jgi:hypothetical protein